MSRATSSTPLLLVLLLAACAAPTRTMLPPDLEAYIAARRAEEPSIPDGRRAQIVALAAGLAALVEEQGELPVTFVCTHNSRRSHLAQVWAQVAADLEGLDGIVTHSGGTEATAFHPRAVAALERAGFRATVVEPGANPVVELEGAPGGRVLRCWSKVFDAAPNPSSGFAAVMTCDDADEACPFVPGAALRAALTYVDPKAQDGTPRESAAYDERCAQIAREMLLLFRLVALELEPR